MTQEEQFLNIMQDLRGELVMKGELPSSSSLAGRFKDFQFDNEKLDEIRAFLASDLQRLKEQKQEGEDLLDEAITESIAEDRKEPEEEPQGEDEKPDVLKLYMEELGQLRSTGDQAGPVFLKRLMSGDKSVYNEAVEHYLPRVVEIARLYEGQGVLKEDLIGEGNMALAVGLSALEMNEDEQEAESMLIRMIMDAMEKLVIEEAGGMEAINKAADVVEKVAAGVEELYKTLGRDVAAEELLAETELLPEEVEEAIRLSEGKIEHLRTGDK